MKAVGTCILSMALVASEERDIKPSSQQDITCSSLVVHLGKAIMTPCVRNGWFQKWDQKADHLSQVSI
jgi:hypothetical protein